ncbi:hypothetical protein EDD15DRAFT_855757 [Pisolithus albus]|nr:hypothetical protein EDD15DRAFT_855757 [Pisolithus albus]
MMTRLYSDDSSAGVIPDSEGGGFFHRQARTTPSKRMRATFIPYMVTTAAHVFYPPHIGFLSPMFIYKQPCIVLRLSSEASCLPNGSHAPADCSLYYGPLYHPHEHVSVFEIAINFVAWLSKTLKSHHLYCVKCDLITNCICLAKSPKSSSFSVVEHCGMHRAANDQVAFMASVLRF